MSNTVSRNVGLIARNRYFLDIKTARLLYNTLILPHLNYCCLIWGSGYASQISKLFILQKRAARIIENVYPPTSSEPIFKHHRILKLVDIAKSQMLLVVHKFLTNQLPSSLQYMFKIKRPVEHEIRQQFLLEQPFSNRNYRLFSTACLGPKLWNEMFGGTYKDIHEVPNSKYVIKQQIWNKIFDAYSAM